MHEVEIEYPDGSKDTFDSYTLEVLFKALDDGEIASFTIRRRSRKIAANPLKRKP